MKSKLLLLAASLIFIVMSSAAQTKDTPEDMQTKYMADISRMMAKYIDLTCEDIDHQEFEIKLDSLRNEVRDLKNDSKYYHDTKLNDAQRMVIFLTLTNNSKCVKQLCNNYRDKSESIQKIFVTDGVKEYVKRFKKLSDLFDVMNF